MKRTPIIAALLGDLTLSTAATAHPGRSGHRHVGVAPAPHVAVRPAQRAVRPATPYCATYGCAGLTTSTRPQGHTVTRSGNASCADGICTRSGSVAGPEGETATFYRSISH